MNKEQAIEKIKKCLALSASANEHEAAIALRQAQALMQQFNIRDQEMLAAGASEKSVKSTVRRKPSTWETLLVARIKQAFGCNAIFSQGWNDGEWVFIGCGAAAEIASYAFEVLYRQVKKHRAAYIKGSLRRCKTATKTKRADLFCLGFVQAATNKLSKLQLSDEQNDQIVAYLEVNYPSIESFQPRNRNGKKKNDRDYKDLLNGANQGESAQLDQGVNQHENTLLNA